MRARRFVVGTVAVFAIIVDRWVRQQIASGRISSGSDFGFHAVVEPRFASMMSFSHPMMAGVVTVVGLAVAVLVMIRSVRGGDTNSGFLFGLIVLAGLNNAIDRWQYGGVWDYWQLPFPWGALSFNWSDVVIVVALIVWIFLSRQQRALEIVPLRETPRRGKN